MKTDYNILNYFNMRALFLGVGLSKILIDAKEMFWLSLIMGTIMGLIILKVIRMELKSKVVNVLVASIFIIISLMILINMISSMYLTEMPKLIVGIPLMLLIIYILTKKEITIYRISKILIVLNGILFLALFVSLLSFVDFINFIYTNTPLKNVLFAAFEYAIFSTVPTFITRDEKNSDTSLIKTYLISSFTMGLLFFLTYGMLGPGLIDIFRYPEYIILKKVTFFETLANLENFISFIWIFDIFIFLVSCANTIKKSINNNKITFAILIALLLLVSYLNKFYGFMISIYKYGFFILLGCLVILYIFNRKAHHN